jgi:glycosyltransferase involved in cell wall biosynthesis
VLNLKDVVVLIPAKNEVNTIGQIVSEIKELFPITVVVIDDNSSDDTAIVALDAGAIVLPMSFSLGAWGAIQTGLRYAEKYGFKIAITMDADGQHKVDSIPNLLEKLEDKQSDVVIGSYVERGSPSRHLAWSFFRKLSGMNLEDLTSGLRAYNHKAIQLLSSKAATLLDYQDLGVLLLLDRAKLHIVETPIFISPRKDGHSRIFSSKWAIIRYMLYTSILCLAHFKPK